MFLCSYLRIFAAICEYLRSLQATQIGPAPTRPVTRTRAGSRPLLYASGRSRSLRARTGTGCAGFLSALRKPCTCATKIAPLRHPQHTTTDSDNNGFAVSSQYSGVRTRYIVSVICHLLNIPGYGHDISCPYGCSPQVIEKTRFALTFGRRHLPRRRNKSVPVCIRCSPPKKSDRRLRRRWAAPRPRELLSRQSLPEARAS